MVARILTITGTPFSALAKTCCFLLVRVSEYNTIVNTINDAVTGVLCNNFPSTDSLSTRAGVILVEVLVVSPECCGPRWGQPKELREKSVGSARVAKD